MEQFHTTDVPASELAEALNSFGKDGWLLVNCWPAETGKLITCVLRREVVFFSPDTQRYEAAMPLSRLTLLAALARCRPKETAKFLEGDTSARVVALEDLAAEHGATVEEVIAQLERAGMKRVKGKPGLSGKVKTDETYSLWTFRPEGSAQWSLWAKKQAQRAAAPKDPEKPTKKSRSSRKKGASSKPFSIEQAIASCVKIKPPQKWMDHGLTLKRLAETEQETTVEAALDKLKTIGLPTANKKPGHDFVEFAGRKVALRFNEKSSTWFLNVKQQEAKEESTAS